MNDFTKEELERIHGCLMFTNDEVSKYLHNEDVSMDVLINKVKSMIDNYCEHDGEIGKDYPAEKCMKCGRYWE